MLRFIHLSRIITPYDALHCTTKTTVDVARRVLPLRRLHLICTTKPVWRVRTLRRPTHCAVNCIRAQQGARNNQIPRRVSTHNTRQPAYPAATCLFIHSCAARCSGIPLMPRVCDVQRSVRGSRQQRVLYIIFLVHRWGRAIAWPIETQTYTLTRTRAWLEIAIVDR